MDRKIQARMNTLTYSRHNNLGEIIFNTFQTQRQKRKEKKIEENSAMANLP